jgi:hypothetical protein
MLDRIFELLGVKEDDWSEVKLIRQDKVVISFTFKHRGHGTKYIKALLEDGQWRIALNRPRPN